MGLDDDINNLLSAPFPRPPTTTTSPVPSPDLFRLTFTDVSYKFAHPPILTPSSLRSCASPTMSVSSSDSRPCLRLGMLSSTPSASGDQFTLPSSFSNPRRADNKLLVIAKHNGSPSTSPSNDSECPISASLLQPFKKSMELHVALSPSSSSEESFYETDEGEFDSGWHADEIFRILTCSPPTTQNPPRPESMLVRRHSVRYSKPLPLTPSSTSPFSPAFPSAGKRQSSRFIPNYPLSLIPTLVRSSSASSSILSSSSSCELSYLSSPFATSPTPFHSRAPHTPASSSSRRPPPRSSTPAYCVFETSDQSSAFSLSVYEDDMDLKSACSYSSESDDFRFDVDLDVHVDGEPKYPMMLPPSLPSSPNETDIANCFKHASMQPTTTTSAYDDLSPSPTPMLKSKWSSSTIGSIREEHERRGPSAKLRLYFGGGGGGKRRSKNSKVVVPQTPTSMKSPSRSSYATKSPAAARRPRGYYGHGRHSIQESDVMIIGYGHYGNGVRRQGSVTPTISDAGSDDSALSSASSGLRRKPIPLLLLHGAT